MRNLYLICLVYILFPVGSCFAQINCDLKNELTIATPVLNANVGDCLCIPYLAYNFEDIQSMQGSISWDPTAFTYKNFNGQGVPITSNSVNANPTSGELAFSWFDITGVSGLTLADGSIIFDVCFDVIGDDCSIQQAPIWDDSFIDIEFGNSMGQAVPFCTSSSEIYIGDADTCGFCISTHGVLCIESKE